MTLTPVQQKFILHWGEMGSRWGINRSVAQIHAILYLSPEPLTAETIAETLDIARSNVSTGLKELQTWGIIRITHRMGDRRDHFETLGDVWEMFRLILIERKRREADQTLTLLRECEKEAKSEPDPASAAKIAAMREFFELSCAFGDSAAKLPPSAIRRVFQLGEAVFRFTGS